MIETTAELQPQIETHSLPNGRLYFCGVIVFERRIIAKAALRPLMWSGGGWSNASIRPIQAPFLPFLQQERFQIADR